jgi:ABC-type lipoprotein release transport system permease subunit
LLGRSESWFRPESLQNVLCVLIATALAAEIPDTVHVFDLVAYAASLLVIVTSCGLAVWIPFLRTARIDPFETLRKD